MSKLSEVVDRESVGRLVRAFYAKILQDDVVGPYFLQALGPDMKSFKWLEHLHTLDKFWMQMMGEENNYRGSPFVPHAFLPNLTKEKFERWLAIFKQTLDEHYVNELSEKFYAKADNLATQFLALIEDDDEWE